MKNCTKCHELKDDTFFGKHRKVCKKCHQLQMTTWVKNNKNRVKEIQKKHDTKFKEKRNLNSKKQNDKKKGVPLSEESLQKGRVRSKKHYEKNKEKYNNKSAEYRARRLGASPNWVNKFYIEEIYDLARRRSKEMGFQWDVDHIIPLNNPIVCGLHVEHNLQVIPHNLNMSKGNRYAN